MLNGPLGDAFTVLTPCLPARNEAKASVSYVFVGIEADALERGFKLLDVVGHQLLFQLHRRGRVLQRKMVVHRDQVAAGRRERRERGSSSSMAVRSPC